MSNSSCKLALASAWVKCLAILALTVFLLVSFSASSYASIVTGDLNLPTNVGTLPSGTVVTTSVALPSGGSVDVNYTLNAFATVSTPAPFINASTTFFGVGSANDPNGGNQQSLDGDDGEQLEINLAFANFVPGTPGETIKDLQFTELSIANGTANPDGVSISFTGFDNNAVAIQQPATINLASLANFDATSTSLFIEPDTAAGNNRISVSGIGIQFHVEAVPEPSSALLIGLAGLGMVFKRRRR